MGTFDLSCLIETGTVGSSLFIRRAPQTMSRGFMSRIAVIAITAKKSKQ
jgi:hypothetical protein